MHKLTAPGGFTALKGWAIRGMFWGGRGSSGQEIQLPVLIDGGTVGSHRGFSEGPPTHRAPTVHLVHVNHFLSHPPEKSYLETIQIRFLTTCQHVLWKWRVCVYPPPVSVFSLWVHEGLDAVTLVLLGLVSSVRSLVRERNANCGQSPGGMQQVAVCCAVTLMRP